MKRYYIGAVTSGWSQEPRLDIEPCDDGDWCKYSDVADLESLLTQWQELEASICPEDVGFAEYIKALQSQLHQEREARQQAEKALELSIVGDCFYYQKYRVGPPETKATCGKECNKCDVLTCWCKYWVKKAKEAADAE